jgi:hypothetical protein
VPAADADSWRPLLCSTLFSEGWNEAWVPSPNGSGGAPRQGWINAADGNLYRLWFFTFAQAFNQGPKGNAYLGAYTIFLPFSRRLDLIINVPFVERNSAASGLPIINPTGQPTFKSKTTFGDLSFTPRVLLHETQDFSLMSEMAVLVPTGQQPIAGKTALVPNVSFWYNFAGRWVIRGGIGDLIPLGGCGFDTLISQHMPTAMAMATPAISLAVRHPGYPSLIGRTGGMQPTRSPNPPSATIRLVLGFRWTRFRNQSSRDRCAIASSL